MVNYIWQKRNHATVINGIPFVYIGVTSPKHGVGNEAPQPKPRPHLHEIGEIYSLVKLRYMITVTSAVAITWLQTTIALDSSLNLPLMRRILVARAICWYLFIIGINHGWVCDVDINPSVLSRSAGRSRCPTHPAMGLLSDMYNCGMRMRRECLERFPRHRLQGYAQLIRYSSE